MSLASRVKCGLFTAYSQLRLARQGLQPALGREGGETVTHPDLDELVRQARRDRPAPSLLSSLAFSLHVPFSP